MADEALGVFRVVGLSVPVVLLISGQRAVLEGAQRFDLSAILRMLGTTAALVIPAIGAVLGVSLPSILLVVLGTRVILSLFYAIATRRAIPGLRWVRSHDWSLLRRVLTFGGWVLVSNTVSPLLVYFDRFALGTIAGLAAVGFYTAPYEGITRILLIPVSVFSSLLPALTSMEAGRETARSGRIASASERILTPVMALPLSLVFVFAPELLRVWLGAQYADQSALALRWLTVGVMANSLASPLMVMLYAKNRPDLPAKFHLVELAIHLPLTIVLIRSFGIAGAAAAWTIRVGLDMSLLLWGAARVSQSPVLVVAGGRVGRSALAILLLLAGLAGSKLLASRSIVAVVAVSAAAIAIFVLGSWRWILGEVERDALTRTLRSYAGSLPRTAVSG